MPSTHNEKLKDLLKRWEESNLHGEPITVDKLCVECPDCLDELRNLIESSNSPSPVSSGNTTIPEPYSKATLSELGDPPPYFEGYEVLGCLGIGGMGVVYKAREIALDRLVAIKTLIPPKPGTPMPDVERFRGEALALGKIQHTNIVQIFAIKEEGALPFFAMEYVAGGNLHHHLNGKPMPQREAAVLVATLAKAVHVAHDSGILHRDLKPTNVLLTRDRTPKVADFGLAKSMEGDSSHTTSGQIIGTPSYMAPEQAAGKKDIGPPADVYGLGAILYECLTARPPFKGMAPGETISDVLMKQPTPPHKYQKKMDRVLEAICLKCLEKRPEDRYASALNLAEDLDCWLEGKPTKARPLSLIRRCGQTLKRNPAAAALAILLLIVAVVLSLQPTPKLPDTKIDPDEEPRRMSAELREGQPITLIGEKGGPRWTRATLGEPLALLLHDPTKRFSLEAKNPRALQLHPSPGITTFRFRAEISNDKADISGESGLFFGLQSYPLSNGKAHLFCVWTFNDRVEPLKNGNSPMMTFFLLREERTADGESMIRSSKLGGGSGKTTTFQPVGPIVGKTTWRTLAVEMDPDNITAIWDGKISHSLDGRAIRSRIRGLLDGVPELRNKEAVFTPDAPLGLFLRESSSTFRNVVVEPR